MVRRIIWTTKPPAAWRETSYLEEKECERASTTNERGDYVQKQQPSMQLGRTEE